jgi:hypothetical protein
MEDRAQLSMQQRGRASRAKEVTAVVLAAQLTTGTPTSQHRRSRASVADSLLGNATDDRAVQGGQPL